MKKELVRLQKMLADCGVDSRRKCEELIKKGHVKVNGKVAVIGDKVELTSQTYRNSNYTVFIRIGSTGGNQASAQDAIKVYGQWNGTNLMAG